MIAAGAGMEQRPLARTGVAVVPLPRSSGHCAVQAWRVAGSAVKVRVSDVDATLLRAAEGTPATITTHTAS